MGYAGKTFVIDCSRGGFNASKNIESLAPELMVEPTKNLKLGEGLRETRDGSGRVNSLQMIAVAPSDWEEVVLTPSSASIYSLIVFNDKIYGTSGSKLFEWNSIDAWVEVAPTFESENRIPSLVTFENALYGGSRSNGKLLKWNGTNAWTEVAPKLGTATEILSLAVFNGKIYGGTTPDGMLYEWNGSNLWVEVAPQLSGAEYINSLIVFNGALYGGTGTFGRLYRWNNIDAWVQVVSQFESSATLRKLVILNNELYAGMDDYPTGGQLLKWDGISSWILMAPQLLNETVKSLVVFKNQIYAGSTEGIMLWNGADAWKKIIPGFDDGATVVRGLVNLGVNLYCSSSTGFLQTAFTLYKLTQPSKITGIKDATFQNLQQSIINSDSDGKIWKDQTSVLKTGLAKNRFPSFAFLNNILFMTNGANVLQAWDGLAASTSDLTNPASDWTLNNDAPVQILVHSRGNSRRLVAIGAAGTPTTIYLSAVNDGNEFVTGLVTLIIDTYDGYGIIGGISFIGRLVLFGKKQAFIVDDSDVATPANWGYSSARWQGGAINWRCIVETDVDVHVMADDGEIYSISAAQEFGDYKRASLTLGSFMHNWIKNNVRTEAGAKLHGVYDPIERAVNWFVVRKGHVDVDTCLIFYLDRPIQEAWMVRDNQDNPSGYNAQCSAIVRHNKKYPTVYTGDSSGYLWKLNQSIASDNNLAYVSKFKTPILNGGLPNVIKSFVRGRILAIPFGTNPITVDAWIDGVKQAPQTVTLGGTEDLYGTGVYGTAVYGGLNTVDVVFPIEASGKRLQLEISNSTNKGRFKIMQILIDYTLKGVALA